MEKIAGHVRQARRALMTLGEVLALKPSDIIRDAKIQRFEYCFDLTWKLLSRYLLHQEGLARMADHRNTTAHIYDEGAANEASRGIRGHYALMEALVARIAAGLKKGGK